MQPGRRTPAPAEHNDLPTNDLRGSILACVDVTWEPLYVDEWGVQMLVRSGTGEMRAELLDAAVTFDENTDKTSVDLKKIYPDLVIHSTVDPTKVEGVDADALLAMPPLPAKGADDFEQVMAERTKVMKLYAEAVGLAPAIFTLPDRAALLAKNGAALERVGKVASRLWGLDKEAEKATRKNSAGTPNEEPTSGS